MADYKEVVPLISRGEFLAPPEKGKQSGRVFQAPYRRYLFSLVNCNCGDSVFEKSGKWDPNYMSVPWALNKMAPSEIAILGLGNLYKGSFPVSK